MAGRDRDRGRARARTRNDQRQQWTSFVPLTIVPVIIVLLAFWSSNLGEIISSSLSSATRTPTVSLLTELYRDRTASHKGPSGLLVTAHPDDEVMFFSPTILGLVGQGWQLRGLCLSTGNSSGLGVVRSSELEASYQVLGIPSSQVTIVDHPELQDNMTARWDLDLVVQLIEAELVSHPVDIIITFDTGGISGHPNHIAIPLALSHLSHLSHSQESADEQSTVTGTGTDTVPAHPDIYHLTSPPIWTKFTGPLYAAMYHHLQLGRRTSETTKTTTSTFTFISPPSMYWKAIRAMMQHRSQLVWFRWLYLLFSRLMWVNELVLQPWPGEKLAWPL